jgi:hypothetical protein
MARTCTPEGGNLCVGQRAGHGSRRTAARASVGGAAAAGVQRSSKRGDCCVAAKRTRSESVSSELCRYRENRGTGGVCEKSQVEVEGTRRMETRGTASHAATTRWAALREASWV